MIPPVIAGPPSVRMPMPADRAIVGDPAVVGRELVFGVLGGHAALQGIALHLHGLLRGQVDLRVGERLARGDQDLALDQVDVGDDLGDGVLDLDARIDLDEVERAGLDIDQEFDRSGVLIPDVAAERDRGVADGLSGRPGRGCVPARSRRSSGAGAEPSSRVRKGGRGCRAGRPGSGPRCAWPCVMNFSMKTSGTPKAVPASRRAWSSAASSASADSTTRMPRPPPPIDALTITGKPSDWASAWASGPA